MILDYNSISIGDIQKQNCLAFKQITFFDQFLCFRVDISQNTLLPLFFKLLAFLQFLRYDGEIDMIYHAWMEYDSLKISSRWNERFGF